MTNLDNGGCMKLYASVFKTPLGWPRSQSRDWPRSQSRDWPRSQSRDWSAVIYNEKGEVERFFLPTTRQKATGYIKGIKRKSLPDVESRVRDYFDGKRVSFKRVAVSQNGGAPFESRVYKALRKIPYGSTVSYSELAAKAGSKGAARAVGTAMSKNRFPLIIPCHRVIRSDGSVGKFTSDGGTTLKRKMLSLEATAR